MTQTAPDPTPRRLSRPEAEDLVRRAMMANGVTAENAAPVARALIAAEIDGQGGHGLARVAAYAAQARAGKVDGAATPRLDHATPGVLRIDAANGFAYPAIDLAVDALIEVTPQTGVTLAAISRSHHCGQLGAVVERLAEAGFVSLMMTNAPAAMAPWGGTVPLFGTNPIAFAAPRADAPSLVIDLSLSQVARGKVMAAAKRGDAIPEGWALAPDGTPTTDPEAAMAGTMAPAGGAKGAALALMVEVLCTALTGANASTQASSFFTADGPPPGVGQVILAIDPAACGPAGFADRMAALATAIVDQPPARLPGEKRLAGRARAEAEGIAIPPHLEAEIAAALTPA